MAAVELLLGRLNLKLKLKGKGCKLQIANCLHILFSVRLVMIDFRSPGAGENWRDLQSFGD